MSESPSYRGRFAPSPTGPLHLGSLMAALGSWLLARQARGEWWVRMEDLDPPREVAGAAQRQLAVLATFGLHSDAAVEWQSQRSDLYQKAIDRLLAEGKAFFCHCSRADLAHSKGIHRHCVRKTRRASPAIRLHVQPGNVISFEDGLQGEISQDVGKEVGDFVLKRADGLWAYQLAVVVDDAAQGMSDVVRGADLLDSTPRQIVLQQALGISTPRYLHLPLIIEENGKKLSKSTAATPVDASNPLPALHAVWRALGQSEPPSVANNNASSFLAWARDEFSFERLPRTRSIPLAAVHNTTDTNAV